MNQLDLIKRSRNLVRDMTNAFFREQDVVSYINEGIERVGQVIPELSTMEPLITHFDEVTHLPKHWQHLLAVYTASRLCTQDERHYQAGAFMNEFETKLSVLADDIMTGVTEIKDPNGISIDTERAVGSVQNEYYATKDGSVRRYREWKDPMDWMVDDDE